jgi:hypothetical protein
LKEPSGWSAPVPELCVSPGVPILMMCLASRGVMKSSMSSTGGLPIRAASAAARRAAAAAAGWAGGAHSLLA